MGKSKRGRPAQPGVRYPGGKLKGEPADAVAKWKRARILAEAQVIDPRWGSAIAQLVFFHRLTDREAAAADRWAEWVGRHDRIKGFPRRTAASPQYDAPGYGLTIGRQRCDAAHRRRRFSSRNLPPPARSVDTRGRMRHHGGRRRMALDDTAVQLELMRRSAASARLSACRCRARALLLDRRSRYVGRGSPCAGQSTTDVGAATRMVPMLDGETSPSVPGRTSGHPCAAISARPETSRSRRISLRNAASSSFPYSLNPSHKPASSAGRPSTYNFAISAVMAPVTLNEIAVTTIAASITG